MSTIEVHDPEFRSLMTITLACVRHVPPAHLDISRFVLCRNYRSSDPEHSCAMGTACKFVHADIDESAVIRSHSIHVNYAWRSADQVSYARLPAGETLHVLAPNNRQPLEPVPTERILLTKGATTHRCATDAPLSHCAHYYFNRMCNRGEQCNFIHAVYIDPSAKDFQRAPPRAGAGRRGNDTRSTKIAVVAAPLAVTPRSVATSARASVSAYVTRNALTSSSSLSDHSAGTTPMALSCADSDEVRSNPSVEENLSVSLVRFRRNPYSLLYVTLPVC